MITKVYIAFDIEKLKIMSDRDIKDIMKKTMVEVIEKDIEKTKIRINIKDDRLQPGFVLAYTTFELNFEVEKNENS